MSDAHPDDVADRLVPVGGAFKVKVAGTDQWVPPPGARLLPSPS